MPRCHHEATTTNCCVPFYPYSKKRPTTSSWLDVMLQWQNGSWQRCRGSAEIKRPVIDFLLAANVGRCHGCCCFYNNCGVTSSHGVTRWCQIEVRKGRICLVRHYFMIGYLSFLRLTNKKSPHDPKFSQQSQRFLGFEYLQSTPHSLQKITQRSTPTMATASLASASKQQPTCTCGHRHRERCIIRPSCN